MRVGRFFCATPHEHYWCFSFWYRKKIVCLIATWSLNIKTDSASLTGQPANCLILKCVKTSPPLCEICWRVWIFLKSPGVVLFRSDNYLFKQRPCPSLPLFKYSTQPWYRTHALPITKCYQLWGSGKAYCILTCIPAVWFCVNVKKLDNSFPIKDICKHGKSLHTKMT